MIDEDRRKFVAAQATVFIRTLIARGNRVLVTSRIYGYRAAPLAVDLPHITVLDFRREEIEIFARQWNRAIAAIEFAEHVPEQRELKAQAEERRLLEEIHSNPGVERLAVNPLLLSMLALLRRQVSRLPQQRIRLYTMYMNALIDNWETNRSPGARVDAPPRPDATKAELVLTPFAQWLQANKASGTATQAEVIAHFADTYLAEMGYNPRQRSRIPKPVQSEAQVRAERFLDDMRQYSGLW